MDCMPMQRSPGPFHYLIHEQAKSLVALQVSTGFVDGLIDTVAYPGILLRGGVQQIQLRTEDRENGDIWGR